ncbi:hypothetical protein ON010_g7679 [Phytophthora cinnamomi]|nr:hypothetical protein ON010_g7679 [Phytophthora cinnamomi]
MTSTRKFCCDDLFRFNNVNLDVLTETVGVSAALSRRVRVRSASIDRAVLVCRPPVQHVVLPAVSVQVAGLLPGAGGPQQHHHGLQCVEPLFAAGFEPLAARIGPVLRDFFVVVGDGRPRVPPARAGQEAHGLPGERVGGALRRLLRGSLCARLQLAGHRDVREVRLLGL